MGASDQKLLEAIEHVSDAEGTFTEIFSRNRSFRKRLRKLERRVGETEQPVEPIVL